MTDGGRWGEQRLYAVSKGNPRRNIRGRCSIFILRAREQPQDADNDPKQLCVWGYNDMRNVLTFYDYRGGRTCARRGGRICYDRNPRIAPPTFWTSNLGTTLALNEYT